ncbi:MAG: hypothetical protein JWO31_1394 [Phycisphaerales bacterium]|nr:hypothetical protein [Phycisphaerales bacterium]
MSQVAAPLSTEATVRRGSAPAATAASFLRHAKVVGLLTLASRLLGLLREVIASHYLGAGPIASAFTVAFTVPNLFRKLFGEGALSAAFIPLYARAVRDERESATAVGGVVIPSTVVPEPVMVAAATDAVAADARDEVVLAQSLLTEVNAAAGPLPSSAPRAPVLPDGSANAFAAAGVNLLVAILCGITVVGEIGLAAVLWLWPGGLRPDHLLAVRLTAIMLPYVVLICGTAFLSGVLQVHRRFAAAAAAPILLNVCHVAVLVIGARALGLTGRTEDAAAEALQTTLLYWLAGFVLVGGVLQVLILLPGLRAVGFRFSAGAGWWTPLTRAMLRLSVPVAIGAGVVQVSVLLDRGLSILLAQGTDAAGAVVSTHFSLLGHAVRYPLEAGAPARLAIAQFMYLFPLGIFATALATAIFPSLSADALDRDQSAFRASLRQGIEAALWEGIPASVGLILVAEPAVRLLFQHGQVAAAQADWVIRSLTFYAAGIWAFSLLQIVSRAYYAVQDTRTPLVMSAINLAVNLVVELPLLWWLGEAGMAVGTLAAFTVQAVLMLWLLDRRVGGLQLGSIIPAVGKMVLATAGMTGVCWVVRRLPGFPAGQSRPAWAAQVAILVVVGGGVYVAACRALGVTVMEQLMPRRFRRRRRA